MDIISHENNQEYIQFALQILKEKQPSIDIHLGDYHIKVWRDSEGILVDFKRIVQYISIDKNKDNLCFDIVVNLRNQEIKPFDNTAFYGSFYIPSEKDLIAIEFINKHFGVFSSQFENVIHEDVEEYKISCKNEASFGYYTLNKFTGEQGPAIQGSYEPMKKPNLRNDDIFNNEIN